MATFSENSFLRINPIAGKPFTTTGKVQRHVMCQDYGACLDRAVKLGWPGFSCDECSAYRLEEGGDPDYWQMQNERAAKILEKILTDEAPRHSWEEPVWGAGQIEFEVL